MSIGSFSFVFPGRAAGPLVAGAVALLALMQTGCASFSIEEAVPTAALAPEGQASALPAPAEPAAAASEPSEAASAAEVFAGRDGTGASAPRDTGEYPNLNLLQTGATDQFTTPEARLKSRELARAISAQRKEGSGVTVKESDIEKMRRLGQTHGSLTLREIEKR